MPSDEQDTRVREPSPGQRAFVFASFAVFVSILLLKFAIRLCVRNASDLPFVHVFAGVAPAAAWLPCEWIVFFFVVSHAIRLQMGIAFVFYDPSWQNALNGISDEAERNAILRHEQAFWLWLVILVGSFSYMLSVTPWWGVSINLFLQYLSLGFWWWSNRKRAGHNVRLSQRDKWETYAIGGGDACVVLLGLLCIAYALLNWWRPALAQTIFEGWLALALFGLLVVHLFVFLGEFCVSYCRAMKKGAIEFWMVATLGRDNG